MADKCVSMLTLHFSQENSNYLAVVDRPCLVTSVRIRSFCSQGVKFISELSIYRSRIEFLIFSHVNHEDKKTHVHLQVEFNRK